jgi:hypothetical protein
MKILSFFFSHIDGRSALIFKLIRLARLIFEFETLLQAMAILGFIANETLQLDMRILEVVHDKGMVKFCIKCFFLCLQKYDKSKKI